MVSQQPKFLRRQAPQIRTEPYAASYGSQARVAQIKQFSNSQITNHKQITIIKTQKSQMADAAGLGNLVLGICNLFVILDL